MERECTSRMVTTDCVNSTRVNNCVNGPVKGRVNTGVKIRHKGRRHEEKTVRRSLSYFSPGECWIKQVDGKNGRHLRFCVKMGQTQCSTSRVSNCYNEGLSHGNGQTLRTTERSDR